MVFFTIHDKGTCIMSSYFHKRRDLDKAEKSSCKLDSLAEVECYRGQDFDVGIRFARVRGLDHYALSGLVCGCFFWRSATPFCDQYVWNTPGRMPLVRWMIHQGRKKIRSTTAAENMSCCTAKEGR
jgi:hypothetical protein